MEFFIPAIILAIASIIILVMSFRISRREVTIFQGILVTNILLICSCLTLIIPTDWQLIAPLNTIFLIGLLAGFTLFSAGYVIFQIIRFHPHKQRIQTIWMITTVIWLITYSFSAIYTRNLSNASQSIPIIIGLVGVGLSGSFLVTFLLWNFYFVTLPELANRSAYWVCVMIAIVAGSALMISELSSLLLPGLTFHFLGVLGFWYGYKSARIIDVRLALIITIRNISYILLMTTAIVSTIFLVDRFNLITSISGLLTAIAIAIILATLSLPVLQLIHEIFDKITQVKHTSLSRAITTYSNEVSLSTSLEDVIHGTTTTINHVLKTQRSNIILLNNTSRKANAVELVVLNPFNPNARRNLYMDIDSPLLHAFTQKRIALTQYDIDFDPTYQSISDDERTFFQSLFLRAYAPITGENRVIGIIGCSEKINKSAYTPDELELLIIIGQQIGTAIRSARLIDDLRHLNTSMISLNAQLKNAKQELEKLDDVKTDFITIASHELRTPLAQVKGYTDIIDSLNDQNMLEPKQTKTLVSNLRRASEQIEELISAMMDVSQLDVNAMDLHFVLTKPDTIIRMAIDPLRDAIEQRNINLETHNLSDLPPIQADMQRIVQAFSNIIINAIKFTPDGGKIEISGHTHIQNGTDHVLIMIKDTGVGIKPHDLELIFQKFYRGFDPQLHSTGSYKFMGAGPGLGTTIAKGIIEGHGGKIWAESTGHDLKTLPGSTFYISMPIKPPEDARRVLPIYIESSYSQSPQTTELPSVPDTSRQTQITTPPQNTKKPEEGSL